MRDRFNFTGELILTGSPMEAQRELLDAIDRLRLGTTVRWLGHLPHKTLPHLYNLARLMVFPSLFEGFGLPVLEAMASACPVICSNSSSLPEVGGEAALYFDPLNSDEIADKLSYAWRDDYLLDQLRNRGLAQSARFGWDQTARQTIEVYRSVVSQQ
jgi:glycosyltransferase involved in cell wall biosynthesis